MLDNFSDALFYIFVCQTTSNFPDVMMQEYKKHRYGSIFFIAFLFINYIIIFNVIIGMFYYFYKSELMTRLDGIHTDQLVKIAFRKYVQQDEFDIYSLDKDLDSSLIQSSSNINKQQPQVFLTQIISNNSNSNSIIINFLLNYANNEKIKIIISILSGICVIFVVMQVENYKESFQIFPIIYFIINTLIFIDSAFRIGTFVRKSFLSYKIFYLFEFGTTLVTIIYLIIHYHFYSSDSILPIIKYLISLRSFRVFYLLLRIESIKIVFKTVYTIIPYCYDNFGLLFILFYLYAILGISLFGGIFTLDKQELILKNHLPPLYIYNNFNDLGNAFVIEFELLIVNNWIFNCEVHSTLTQTLWTRFFFVVFYILAVLLLLNTIIAFVIEWIVQSWKNLNYSKRLASLDEKTDNTLIQQKN